MDSPQIVTQLKPLVLCSAPYKAISNVLVNRIKPLLNKIVAPTQTSSVPGRPGNAPHDEKHCNIGYMAVKIDLEKAYNRF